MHAGCLDRSKHKPANRLRVARPWQSRGGRSRVEADGEHAIVALGRQQRDGQLEGGASCEYTMRKTVVRPLPQPIFMLRLRHSFWSSFVRGAGVVSLACHHVRGSCVCRKFDSVEGGKQGRFHDHCTFLELHRAARGGRRSTHARIKQ